MPNRTLPLRPLGAPGTFGSFGTLANGSIATIRSPPRSSSSARARRRRRYASPPLPLVSEGIAAQLAGADAPDGLDGNDPVLPVADGARASVLDDGRDHLVGVGILDHQLEPQLGDVLDAVLRPPIDLGMTLLSPVTAH